ncbi:MlaD family protein [Lyngbya sp. CCY1209]|uniref:MlaD family protein n=1 Tax=Lyngbya sp. CCY1209 TaxID=2886103 RepID=UPI002D2104FA|nr:MlaD family protein [Lyngbya sp. CCY1209]MEB3883374.1 MlaD family protein [Lyngbya sp. CCY1209]
MRSRTVREGSVGFLILFGLGLFGATALWLRGVRLGQQNYQIVAEFPNATGMQVGTPVRYRGVKVGQVRALQPKSNGVVLTLNIDSVDLVMPRNSQVVANQIGLLSETYVDIVPAAPLPSSLLTVSPLGPDCPEAILCDGAEVKGISGISMERLIATMLEFGELYSDPQLFANLNLAVQNTAIAAREATELSAKMGEFVDVAKVELGSFSQSIDEGIGSFSSQLDGLSTDLRRSIDEVSGAAVQSANSLERVATQVSTLAEQVNTLVATNRSTLVTTLNNINQTTEELGAAIATLTPILGRVEQGQLLENLEALSANAAEASANLRDVSQTVNNPDNLILLQQTLDSARATLQNLQKVTSDIDDLTGDPQFRDNLRNIVNGLGNILTSTQELERQTAVAQTLVPLSQAAEAGDEEALKLLFSEIDPQVWAWANSPHNSRNSALQFTPEAIAPRRDAP